MPLLGSKPDPAVTFLGRLRWPAGWRRPLSPSIARGAATGIVAAMLAIAIYVFVGDNLHAVQPERTFRAGQMKPARLDATVRERGIRTIVNLRGYCGDFDWYRDECRVTRNANVSQEDITLSAIRLPSPSEIRRLLEVLDRSEYPILLHCRQGVDRTGLASVIVKLLEPGTAMSVAERQLSLAFGFVPYNGTENMRQFFDLYREWLDRQELAHSAELFRHWALREYCPGASRADIEFVDWPSVWHAGDARLVRIRVANTSVHNWMLRPGVNLGVHARYRVDSADGKVLVDERAGLFDALVPPGRSIDLELGVPRLTVGEYVIRVEMIDSDQNSFSQFGVEPATREIHVTEN